MHSQDSPLSAVAEASNSELVCQAISDSATCFNSTLTANVATDRNRECEVFDIQYHHEAVNGPFSNRLSRRFQSSPEAPFAKKYRVLFFYICGFLGWKAVVCCSKLTKMSLIRFVKRTLFAWSRGLPKQVFRFARYVPPQEGGSSPLKRVRGVSHCRETCSFTC